MGVGVGTGGPRWPRVAAAADVYTWVDVHGNVNVSNLAPPAGARVTSVAHESADVIARAEAARKAAQDAEVKALADRVAELERAAEQPMRGPPPVLVAGPPSGYGAPPPPQYAVTHTARIAAGRCGPVVGDWLRVGGLSAARLRGAGDRGVVGILAPLPFVAQRSHATGTPFAPGHGGHPMAVPQAATRVVMPQQSAVRARHG